MKTISKIAAIALVAVALVGVNTASAATVAELQAMIASLSAQIAALSGTTSTPAAVTFTSNLTVGSKGAEVTALQNFLIGKGYNTLATGYFGPMTKAALAAYQTAKGITPAAGYFGPMTRASVNGEAVTTTTTTTGSTGITTNGVEGSIVVTKDSAGTKSTVYEGDTNVAVLGVKVEAKDSDMSVSRIKLDLGTSTNIYNKVFSKVYLTNAAGTVLASKDLNSDTVSRDSSVTPARYSVTLAGFNSVVSKGTKSTFYVKFDVRSSISTDYRNTQTIALAGSNDDAVRAIDGAGIDQYSGGNGIYSTVSVSTSLSDAATLTLSTDPSLVKAATNVANDGSNSDEKDAVVIGSFRALAEKSGVLVRDLSVTVATSGPATFPTAYLFEGSTQIASASYNAGTYSFTSVDQTVDKDATKTYTVKVDVRGATTAVSTIKLSTVTATAETKVTGNSLSGSGLTVSSVGETQSFVSKGAATTLTSRSIDITTAKDQNSVTTEAHLTATFNVNINAVAADAVFSGTSTAFEVKVYRGSTDVTSALASYTTVEYNQNALPTGITASSTGTGFTVSRNNGGSVVPVIIRVDVTGSSTVASLFPNTGSYSVRLNKINYTSNGAAITNDNSTNSAWVTDSKSRP